MPKPINHAQKYWLYSGRVVLVGRPPHFFLISAQHCDVSIGPVVECGSGEKQNGASRCCDNPLISTLCARVGCVRAGLTP